MGLVGGFRVADKPEADIKAWADRKALEMGPTPGEWYWSDAYPTQDGRKTWSLIGDGGFGILSCDGDENSPQSVNTAAADLIAACDPDTIRELLAERDALEVEIERLRKELAAAAEQPESHAITALKVTLFGVECYLPASIAEAVLEPSAIDLTVKSDPQGWAARLGGLVRLAAIGFLTLFFLRLILL